MRVYVIPHETPCHGHWTDGSLLSLQHLVGGFIELCTPPQLRERGIELLCNEEGLLKGLPLNVHLWPFFLVGQLVAVGTNGEEFDSLTDDQLEYLKEWLANLKD